MLRRCRSFALLVVFVGNAAFAANPWLEQARAFYEEVQYEQCVQRLQRAAEHPSTDVERVQIALYLGLCQFSLGREAEAQAAFADALTLDRDATLPPFTSPKATALFSKVQRALPPPPEPRADSPRRVELVPATPQVQQTPQLGPTEARSRVAPAVLGGVAVASAGAGTLFLLRARDLERRANAEPFESTAYELGDAARSNMTAAWIGFGAASAAATAALLTWAID